MIMSTTASPRALQRFVLDPVYLRTVVVESRSSGRICHVADEIAEALFPSSGLPAGGPLSAWLLGAMLAPWHLLMLLFGGIREWAFLDDQSLKEERSAPSAALQHALVVARDSDVRWVGRKSWASAKLGWATALSSISELLRARYRTTATPCVPCPRFATDAGRRWSVHAPSPASTWRAVLASRNSWRRLGVVGAAPASQSVNFGSQLVAAAFHHAGDVHGALRRATRPAVAYAVAPFRGLPCLKFTALLTWFSR